MGQGWPGPSVCILGETPKIFCRGSFRGVRPRTLPCWGLLIQPGPATTSRADQRTGVEDTSHSTKSPTVASAVWSSLQRTNAAMMPGGDRANPASVAGPLQRALELSGMTLQTPPPEGAQQPSQTSARRTPFRDVRTHCDPPGSQSVHVCGHLVRRGEERPRGGKQSPPASAQVSSSPELPVTPQAPADTLRRTDDATSARDREKADRATGLLKLCRGHRRQIPLLISAELRGERTITAATRWRCQPDGSSSWVATALRGPSHHPVTSVHLAARLLLGPKLGGDNGGPASSVLCRSRGWARPGERAITCMALRGPREPRRQPEGKR